MPSVSRYGLRPTAGSVDSADINFPLLLPDGSAAAPSLAFASNTDLGFYKVGGTIAFSQDGNVYNVFGYSVNGMHIAKDSAYAWSGNASALAAADLLLVRDAANTLALRNGVNANTLNIYNTYTNASNYERAELVWDTDTFMIRPTAAGTGTVRAVRLGVTGGTSQLFGNNYFYGHAFPGTTDVYTNGGQTLLWKEAFVARAVMGSKSKALTGGAATTFVTVAIPQTTLLNVASGECLYTVYATDGTDTQALTGTLRFSAVNKAGTVTAQVTDDQLGTEAASAGTLTAALTATTSGDNVILQCNAASSLTETTLRIDYRLNMTQPQTVTPA